MPAIQSSEITLHPATAMNQTGSAGGIINNSETITDLQKGILKDITDSDRLAGTEKHYKFYRKIGNPDNKTYGDGRIVLSDRLAGDTVINLRKGTFSNVWSDVSSDRNYGCGLLNTALNANDQTIIIDTRGSTYDQFNNGDLVCINSKADPSDDTGEVEFVRIDQEPTWNGDQVTIHIDTPLSYAYSVSRTLNDATVTTRISSVIEYGDVEGAITTSDKTSAHGTVDESQVTVNSIAGISQTLTITFVSGLDFTVVSNIAGITLPNGQKTTTYEPQNDDYTLPYLSIPAEFWTNDGSGDWVAGDTIKIHTTPCAMPYWIVVTVPSNATAADLETVDIAAYGYSLSN